MGFQSAVHVFLPMLWIIGSVLLHWWRQQCQMRGHLQQYPASESFSKWHVLDYHCSWKKQTPASNIVKRWRGFCIVEYHLQTTGLESWVTQLSLVMVAWDGKCMTRQTTGMLMANKSKVSRSEWVTGKPAKLNVARPKPLVRVSFGTQRWLLRRQTVLCSHKTKQKNRRLNSQSK